MTTGLRQIQAQLQGIEGMWQGTKALSAKTEKINSSDEDYDDRHRIC